MKKAIITILAIAILAIACSKPKPAENAAPDVNVPVAETNAPEAITTAPTEPSK